MSRIEKTIELTLVIMLILAGPREIVKAALPKIFEKFNIPWGITSFITIALFIWIFLYQENTQIRKRLLLAAFAIPSITLLKIYLDHGWSALAFLVFGKVPFIGDLVESVGFLAGTVAFGLCLPSVLFIVIIVLIIGDVTGKIPITVLPNTLYQILSIIKRWLPWNRD